VHAVTFGFMRIVTGEGPGIIVYVQRMSFRRSVDGAPDPHSEVAAITTVAHVYAEPGVGAPEGAYVGVNTGAGVGGRDPPNAHRAAVHASGSQFTVQLADVSEGAVQSDDPVQRHSR